MSISIIVPTLGRPNLLGPLASNVWETLKGSYTLLFVVDPEDEASRKVVKSLGNAKMILSGGTYPRKINRGVDATNESLVLLANDDVVFHPGWYKAARAAFTPGVHVVGPSDLSPATENGDHATFPIVHRSYIEDPGAVWGEKGTTLCEDYHHNFSETELWQLAVDRGVAKFVPECVIEHRHPDWGKAEVDQTYERGARTNFEQDGVLFEARKAGWQR